MMGAGCARLRMLVKTTQRPVSTELTQGVATDQLSVGLGPVHQVIGSSPAKVASRCCILSALIKSHGSVDSRSMESHFMLFSGVT